MFRFEHPDYLYFLALVPFLTGVYFLGVWLSGRASSRFGDTELIRQLVPDYSRGKQRLKLILYLIALTLLILAWANPQLGVEQQPSKREAADVYIALDVSRSMLAEDISPNRLGRAKRVARDLVKAIRTERISTILFAGYAFIQTPLTTDFAQVDLLLRSARPELIDFQGTAIDEAIDLALQMAPDNKKGNSALIIFTDGEAHEEGWEVQAREAREKGFAIYTVGVGSSQGGPIPIEEGGRRTYLLDDNGNIVQSRINADVLQQLAIEGGGVYFPADLGTAKIIRGLSEELDKLEKQEFDQPIYGEYRSYFQYLIALTLLLLIAETLLSNRRKTL